MSYSIKKGALDDAFMDHQISDEQYLRALEDLELDKAMDSMKEEQRKYDAVENINEMRRKRIKKHGY